MGVLDACTVQKVLEVVDLADLRADREGLLVLCSCCIVVVDGLLRCVEHLRVEEEAADDEACTSFASLAMHRHNRIFQEVVLNQLQLLVLEVIAVVVACQAVDDVKPLLDASLDEEEHVKANVEDISD